MNFEDMVKAELAKQVAEGRITQEEAARRLTGSSATVVNTESSNLQAKASSGIL